MDIQYVGENLIWGYAGRAALIIAFLLALVSALSYLRASSYWRIDHRQWRCYGRRAFKLHAFMIAVASFALMYILLNQYYEYRYVWVHMENDLSLGYQIASFWAGQEGSLLFWVLCQVVFGVIIMRVARKWEMPVMTIFSLSQVFMLSMLLGIRWGGIHIGLDPFLLLRQAPENIDNIFFQNPEYLLQITDGNGLNPLLRNFWMLSHPPVTFIGYAAVLVPFSFALAGLWKGKFHEWIKPSLPWTILAILFLGAGILLGGVWAYESLTFGGFWAWDPIENASLVPWLILVAALHLKLVAQKKRHTYAPALLFTMLAFVFVIYATYLTRSGVLSETSVHSFGSDGMGTHILVYLFTFLALGLILLVKQYRRLPSKKSEKVFSRDFWLFIGALVMILSAFQIIFSTSIPVLNKFFGTSLAPPANVVNHYNTWQLPFAVAIALMIGVTHFIRWSSNNIGIFGRQVSLSVGLALIFSVIAGLIYELTRPDYLLMLFASLFALFSSLDMLLRFNKRFISKGGAITHLGMSMFLLAVLITFSQQQTISKNTSGYHLGDSFTETENLLLLKGEILPMGNYHVTYAGKEFDGERVHYQVDFLKKNSEGDYYKAFSSYPSVLLNERMGNVYEPFARVLPTRDIFTYITYADLDQGEIPEPHKHLETVRITVGDSISIGNNHLFFNDIHTKPLDGINGEDRLRVTADMVIYTHFGEHYHLRPAFVYADGEVIHEDDTAGEAEIRLRLKRAAEEPYTVDVEIYEERLDFIIIKTIIFPMINLLWVSIVVMMAGLYISYRGRKKQARGKM